MLFFFSFKQSPERYIHSKDILQCKASSTSMERENSELYLRNCQIMRENERLRRKAQRLNHENQALLSELRRKLAARNAKRKPEFEIDMGSNSVTDQIEASKHQALD
ncbi:protein LITTLE ZIPPER 4-like [Lycium barbarum]|uniref:protein LITTLE ZIPPER 4-like n=1 Tax=Lycium barbarum TaxID=112863 RepID=UPI00293F1FF3|nr:protein LITTLE ZIPPER 4-like [Lycium barbarum]